jgi:hypothetical protein
MVAVDALLSDCVYEISGFFFFFFFFEMKACCTDEKLEFHP